MSYEPVSRAELQNEGPQLNPELIRSVSSFKVLAGWGAVFGDAPKYFRITVSQDSDDEGPDKEASGHERVWELGRPAERIDDFYSHCWADGQYTKCLALLVLYNGRLAQISAMSFATLMFLCGAYQKWNGPNVAMPNGLAWILCLDVPAAIFFAFLCFGHTLSCNAVAHEGWLDKICVHQGNDDLKAEGIKLIGKILQRTERMIVLYSDEYAYRLWCMYEMGQFLHHHTVENVWVIPLANPIFWVSGFLCSIAAQFVGQLEFRTSYYDSELHMMSSLLGSSFWGSSIGVSLFWVTAYSPFVVPLCYALTLKIEAQDMLQQNMRNFSVSRARCKFEGDRLFVETSLRELWGDIANFEAYVQNTVADSLINILGTSAHVPYTEQLLIWMPIIWDGYCDILTTTDEVAKAQGIAGGWKVYLIVSSWWYLTQALLLWPVLMWFFLRCVKMSLTLSTRRIPALVLAALGSLFIIQISHTLLAAMMAQGSNSLSEGQVLSAILCFGGSSSFLLIVVKMLY